LNLTRQFLLPNQDEFLQLGLTLYYPPELFQTIESFETWSINHKTLKAFKTMIEVSDGFQAALSINSSKVEITLEKT